MAINVITISGNAGRDAVLRTTPAGKFIATFTLPAKSGFGDKEKVSWLQCKMFGAMAEKLSQSITKGAKVTVSGAFVLEEWERDDGTKASMPTILVSDIDLPPKQSGQQQASNNGWGQQPAPRGNHRAQQEANNETDFDDDIPFASIGLQYPSHAIHSI